MSNDLGIAVQARLRLFIFAAQAVQYCGLIVTHGVYRYLSACIRSLAVVQHMVSADFTRPRPRQ